jgi:chemotaxis protein MotB
MLIAMMNLGTSVDDAVDKIEASYAQEKAADAVNALATANSGSGSAGLVGAVVNHATDEERTLELILPATTLFASGGYALSPGAAKKLHGLADDLRQADGIEAIEIVGHTDGEAPKSGAAYDNNFTLSSLRAGAVASALLRFGIDQRLLTVRGMGSLQPLAPERDGDGRPLTANMARNRRVSILLKMRRGHVKTAH